MASSSAASDADRRKVIVRLTERGLDLVDEAIATHMATEREILATLSPRQQHDLARLLRAVLVSLGDGADDHDLTS